ncbi:hypothetical protein K9M47_00260 [Candidatus Gracilibacteria bacterium]|nr:hypothetical protein [Candidatus Gracilibacteria bacterium]
MKYIHTKGAVVAPEFPEIIITWSGSDEKEAHVSCPWCGEDIDGDDLEEIKSILLSDVTNHNK